MSTTKQPFTPRRLETKHQIPRDTIISRLNPHLLNLLKISPEHDTEIVTATQLLTPARFDLMAKVIYAKHRALGCGLSWATYVYREHLRIFNDFNEGDSSGKNNFSDYQQCFDELLDSILSTGFNQNISMLPVGEGAQIIDGAHRLGAALVHNLTVPVIHFDVSPDRFDYHYFCKRGLAEEILDAMALEYCRLSPHVKIAALFPVARQHLHTSVSLIGKTKIIYEKKLTLTNRGRGNFIRLLYAGEHWVGDGRVETAGVRDHIENRFDHRQPVTLIFFEHEDLDTLQQVKHHIRMEIGLGNHSIHISDSHTETCRIAEVVLNQGGRHWLNHHRVKKFPIFLQLLNSYKTCLPTETLGRGQFCVDGSSVLASYGIRDVNDLDYLSLPSSASLHSEQENISCHNAESQHYEHRIEDLITDPRMHFYYQGLKFLTIEQLQYMKSSRNDPKDRLDIHRIKALTEGSGLLYSPPVLLGRLRESVLSFRYRCIRWLRHHLPDYLLPVARYLYQLPSRLSESTGPDQRKIIYRGFVLHYSKGTSLVHGISNGKVYEPAVTSRIVQALHISTGKNFLDIGANIGLISLNIIHEVPDATIIAFEPGVHQADLLSRTLTDNHLEDRISLNRIALGQEPGKADFVVHHSKHASGDGFKDTGRAGTSQIVKVPVTTLDIWWQTSGQPAIDVVKMDTEGAELMILHAATKFLSNCQPTLIMEIDHRNLKAYPYDATAIVSWLNKIGYRVETINGKLVTTENMKQHQSTSTDYVAIYTRTH